MDANFSSIPLDLDKQCNPSEPVNWTVSEITSNLDEPIVNEPIVDIETIQYKPLEYHWFYTSFLADKLIWVPMSYKDSRNLEKIYLKNITDIKRLRKQTQLEQCEYLKKNKMNMTVSIKGGRFEVDLIELVKRPIYWSNKTKSDVRRCLWFFKENNEQRFLPYDEEYSQFLEIEYEKTIKTNIFHKRIDYIRPAVIKQPAVNESNEIGTSKEQLISEEAFVFHSTTIMLHFTQATMLDEYGNLNSDAKRPRIVKRGLIDVVEKVEPDEIENIDHLCFVVHGIGDGCDLRFRPIVECVDDFRDIGAYMIQSHLKNHIDSLEINGRVEFLPISWHHELHGDPTGVDNRLKPITLPSIPKLRQYSNTTILDVLFYTSPIYCQTIVSKVGNELNRLTQIFLERNPYFSGKISLVGHSLGSLILFDLLSHQYKNDETNKNETETESNVVVTPQNLESLQDFLNRLNLSDYQRLFEAEKITTENLCLLTEADLIQIGIPLGPRRVLLNEFKNHSFRKEQEEVEKKIKSNLETLKRHESDQRNLIELNAINLAQKNTADYFKYGLAGTGQLVVKYPQLNFKVSQFFALGSPIAMFLTVRGIEKLGLDFKFPTCDEFFNVYHPFDPVAYRFEPLICADPILKPVLMPHHKGRKRMHIELRENLTKVSEDLKQKVYGQLNKAWSSLAEFAKLPKVLSNQVLAGNTASITMETTQSGSETDLNIEKSVTTTIITPNEILTSGINEQEMSESDKIKVNMGQMNQGRRIDYVLQERPIESFNEYLFALASHACYWESEDTLLLIIKEVYGLSETIDANTELQLTEQQQQASSWLTQAAASTISTNVQKTLSYFSISLPQSLTSVLPTTGTSILYSSKTDNN